MTLVTVEEFANRYGEAVSTVRKQCQAGELPSLKRGVRWKIDIDEFEKQAKEKMRARMTKKIEVTKVTESNDDWIKRLKAKSLERIRVL